MEAPKEMEAPIKAGYMEELRFAKRQQWYVAAAAIGLIGSYRLGLKRPFLQPPDHRSGRPDGQSQ